MYLVLYLEFMGSEMGERMALNKIKQLIGQFGVGLPGAAKLRESVHRSENSAVARAHIEAFFEPYMEMHV